MAKNESLHKASVAKQDEFYTQISDIERELVHYEDHFRGKVIFCNCDDPAYSNFWRYFQLKFYQLGLKKLVSTHYDPLSPSYKMEIVRKEKGAQLGIPDYVQTPLKQNGDFRSEECIEILKEADVVVTNPPFSLFREYLAQLMEYEKKFVIIGNINAVTYKEVFPLIMNNRIWLGYKSGQQSFAVPDCLERNNTYYMNGQKYAKFGNICWFTNLDIPKRHEGLILVKNYSPELYPKYDNYDAIEVGKKEEQEQILDYELMVYFCEGTDREKLDWFRIVNIAGEKLTEQELRNANYPCAWLTHARQFFSKTNKNLARNIGKLYLSVDWNRQGGLEKVIKWYLGNPTDANAINNFMSDMKQRSDVGEAGEATELIDYYKAVISWVKKLFPVWRERMNKVEWGILYNKYHKNTYDIEAIEETVARLYADNDVTAKEGIYEYIFDCSESHLHIRQFPPEIKTHVYELQGQKCKDCGQHFSLADLQAHHNIRWIDGGHTTVENCVLLCRNCHGARHRAE